MSGKELFMPFPQPQLEAIFLHRNQRFLAEMAFPDGAQELVYCANSGALAGCLAPGSEALLWDSENQKRKRRYTWRAVEFNGVWVGTDTHLSNRLVEEALKLKLIPGFETYDILAREQQIEDGFRVDFVLSGPHGECLLEVKSATVVENGVARYPDSVTPRGVRQLKALTRRALLGQRAALLFLVQRADANSFVVSRSYDPAYAEAFEKALEAGVEVLAMAAPVCREGFRTPRLLPYAQTSITAIDTNQGFSS